MMVEKMVVTMASSAADSMAFVKAVLTAVSAVAKTALWMVVQMAAWWDVAKVVLTDARSATWKVAVRVVLKVAKKAALLAGTMA